MSVSGVSSNSVIPPYHPPSELQPSITPKPGVVKDSVSISNQAQQLAATGVPQTKLAQEEAKLVYPITGYGFSTGGLS